jgi:hypothetical protein
MEGADVDLDVREGFRGMVGADPPRGITGQDAPTNGPSYHQYLRSSGPSFVVPVDRFDDVFQSVDVLQNRRQRCP